MEFFKHHRAGSESRSGENLERWKASGEPERWVVSHNYSWNHDDWLSLLEALKKSDYWPMNPDDVGTVLEEQKRSLVSAVKLVKFIRGVREQYLSEAFSKVRERRRGTPPGTSGAELVIVVGFNRMPEPSDLSALLSSDKEAGSVRVFTLRLGGDLPSSTEERRAIIIHVGEEHASPRLGHAIDWGKVTYELLQNFLIVQF
jgi:hypothetical protein